MASAFCVLVMLPISELLTWTIALAATSRLARHNGLELKSMSYSLHRGLTAEFYQERDSERKIRN